MKMSNKANVINPLNREDIHIQNCSLLHYFRNTCTETYFQLNKNSSLYKISKP